MAKTVLKQRSRSSTDVHGSSWVAPKLQQLSPRVCYAPRHKSPCTDLLDAASAWDHLCSSLVPRRVWGDLLLEVMGVRFIQHRVLNKTQAWMWELHKSANYSSPWAPCAQFGVWAGVFCFSPKQLEMGCWTWCVIAPNGIKEKHLKCWLACFDCVWG